jgi:hypothetical protein
MPKKDKTPPRTEDNLMDEPTIYEQMCMNIYAYQYGSIGFLELLEQFEHLLCLRSDETEVPDV